MRSLAIIPARSGSKGLKDKNIADICGRPLIDYSIKAALESCCFTKVMLSTDSEEYAQIGKKCGAEIPFIRSKTFADDTSSSWDVVREVLSNYDKMGEEFDYVMLLQPTSPLRTSEDIMNAFELLNQMNATNIVSVTEVSHPIQWCFTLDNNLSMENYSKSPFAHTRRQDLEKNYQENGAIYLVNSQKIRSKTYNLYADNCIAYIMPRERSIDIDDRLDLLMLETILNNC